MKLIILGLGVVAALPAMVALAVTTDRARGWLLWLAVVATGLGARGGLQLEQTLGYRGTDHGWALHVSDLAALALAVGLHLRHPEALWRVPPNALPLSLLGILGLASASASAHPEFAAYAMFTGCKALLLYVVVIAALGGGVDRWYIWCALVTVGFMLAGTAVEQTFFTYLDRIRATFEHPNTLPTYNLVFMPALWLWRLCDPSMPPRARRLTDLSCAGMAFAVLRTGSRGGWACSLACLIATLAVGWWRAPSRATRQVVLRVVLALPLAAVLLAPTIARRFETAPEQSGEAREEFKRAAWMQAQDYVLGVGLNHYSWAVDEVPRYARTRYITAQEEGGSVAHHIYLLTAAELGWPGLACLLVAVFRLLLLTWRGGMHGRNLESTLQAGLCIGLAGAFGLAQLEWVLRQHAPMQMLAVAAGFAVYLARCQGLLPTHPRGPSHGPPLEVEGT